jgi:hypothetical protein
MATPPTFSNPAAVLAGGNPVAKGRRRQPGVQKFRLTHIYGNGINIPPEKRMAFLFHLACCGKRAEETPRVSKAAGPETEVWTGADENVNLREGFLGTGGSGQ